MSVSQPLSGRRPIERKVGSFDPVQDLIPRQPQSLSADCLRWLDGAGYLSPSRYSPLAFARGQEIGCRPERGHEEHAHPSGGNLHPLARALKILERPRVRIRFGITVPGQEASIHQFFVRGHEAVYGLEEEEGYRFNEPVALQALLEILTGGLRCRPLEGCEGALAMLPKLFQLVSALWPERGKSARDPIFEEELRELLPADQFGAGAAASLLEEMVSSEVLQPRRGSLMLHPSYLPWLELVWSGHVFEIERAVESEEGWLPAQGEKLLFVGPSGRRVLCDDVTVPPQDGDSEGSGEHLFLFNRPSQFELLERLERILRPAPAISGAESEEGSASPRHELVH